MKKIKYLITLLLLPNLCFASLKQNQDLVQEGVIFVTDDLVVVHTTAQAKCFTAQWILFLSDMSIACGYEKKADLDSKENCFVIKNNTVRVCTTEEETTVNKLAVNWTPIILPAPSSIEAIFGRVYISDSQDPLLLDNDDSW